MVCVWSRRHTHIFFVADQHLPTTKNGGLSRQRLQIILSKCCYVFFNWICSLVELGTFICFVIKYGNCPTGVWAWVSSYFEAPSALNFSCGEGEPQAQQLLWLVPETQMQHLMFNYFWNYFRRSVHRHWCSRKAAENRKRYCACVFWYNMSVLSISQNRNSILKWKTLFIHSHLTILEKAAIFWRP